MGFIHEKAIFFFYSYILNVEPINMGKQSNDPSKTFKEITYQFLIALEKCFEMLKSDLSISKHSTVKKNWSWIALKLSRNDFPFPHSLTVSSPRNGTGIRLTISSEVLPSPNKIISFANAASVVMS